MAGIAIRSSLRAGFSDGQDPGTMMQQALLQGVTSVALNYATDQWGLDPLLANIAYSAVGSLLEAAFVPRGPDDNRTILEKMTDTYTENTLTFLGYNPEPSMYDQRYWDQDSASGTSVFNENRYNSAWSQYYWQESAHMAQVQGFTDIIKDQGIETALNTYATGLFNSIAVNSLANVTGVTLSNIGSYIKNSLDSFLQDPTSVNNVQKTIEADGTETFDVGVEEAGVTKLKARLKKKLDPVTGEYYYEFDGYEVADEFSAYGEWGADSENKVGLTAGEIKQMWVGQEVIQQIEKDQAGSIFQKKVIVYDPISGLKTTLNPLQGNDILDLGLESSPLPYWYMTYENDSLDSFYPDPRSQITYIVSGDRIFTTKETTKYTFYDGNNNPVIVPNGVELWRYYDKDGTQTNFKIELNGVDQIVGEVKIDDGLGHSVTYNEGQSGLKVYVLGNEVFVSNTGSFLQFNFPYPEGVDRPTTTWGMDMMDDMLIQQRDIIDLDNSDILNSLNSYKAGLLENEGITEDKISGRVYLFYPETEADTSGAIPGLDSYSTGTFVGVDLNSDISNRHNVSTMPNEPGIVARATIGEPTIKEKDDYISKKAINLVHKSTAAPDMNTLEYVYEGTYSLDIGDNLEPYNLSFNISAEVDANVGNVKFTFTSSLGNGTNGEVAGNFFTATHSNSIAGPELDNSFEYVLDSLKGSNPTTIMDPTLIVNLLTSGVSSTDPNYAVIQQKAVDFVNQFNAGG